jgi:Spy/CpxP family protein refolding chaperone
MKKILFLLIATMFAAMSNAQEHGGEKRQRREFNPEEFAQRQTDRLKEALQLSEEQYQAVMLMNYADALTMKENMDKRREEMEKMRAEGKKPERTRPTEEQMNEMMKVQQEREQIRNGNMQKILTPEQYGKYLEIQEDMRKNMRHGQGMRRGGGRGNR